MKLVLLTRIYLLLDSRGEQCRVSLNKGEGSAIGEVRRAKSEVSGGL